ncbi:hypothetical protein F6U93_14040 [Tamlana haliotis]|uniref:Uncharacterized protein n=1 Tax=Pseudotamlana haliotis TaxID=2614804 RepID=A0A6N6MB08_9FLAO|nr:hypothetical protein [Tamlana haliotis]KAB1066535.1 hypothetical protein F6U93_14040 [Tamlana haliotis]
MKYGEFSIESHKVEFHNSVWGVETVFVDNHKVSEKLSITGAEHEFQLDSKAFTLKSEANFALKNNI